MANDTPEKIQATIDVYRALMTEAKMRLDAVWSATRGKITAIPPLFVAEFCFLQLRMISELVAVGCLVAHEDIPATQTKKFRSEARADELMKRLTELHPDFFPRPAKMTSVGDHAWHLGPIKEGFMTKDEFINMVNLGGRVLHRSPLKKLLSPNSAVQTSFDEIDHYAQQMSNLLRIHYVTRLGGDTIIVSTMKTSEKDDTVQVVIIKAM
jgi:hypothetical protein